MKDTSTFLGITELYNGCRIHLEIVKSFLKFYYDEPIKKIKNYKKKR
jgi:hypothetical protein